MPPLLAQLDFIDDPAHWGYKFRFGLLAIGENDMRRIAHAMQADMAALSFGLEKPVHGFQEPVDDPG